MPCLECLSDDLLERNLARDSVRKLLSAITTPSLESFEPGTASPFENFGRSPTPCQVNVWRAHHH